MKEKLLNRVNDIAAYVAIFSLIIVLLVVSIDVNCFDKSFFHSEYEKLETGVSIGMTQKDLNKATDILLDYLKDRRNNVDVMITLKGNEQPAFNSKEVAHMSDVKKLYQFAINLRNICLVLFLGSTAYLIFRLKKGALTLLSIDYMKAASVFAVIFAFLGLWAYFDFDAFWTLFHELAFRNDLWLLNPATDLMINMFPAPFFSALVFRIIAMFAGSFIVLFLLSYTYLRVRLNRLHNEVSEHV